MASLVEDRMAVARAAMAGAIARRAGMPLARADGADEGEGSTFLTLNATPPVGYPMETELLPLEAILRDAEATASGGDADPARPIDTADVLLGEIDAFVHDRLLNPNLPFAAITPVVTDLRPVNEVYGHTLRRAVFAGGVAASSPRAQAAHRLLFEAGAPSAALVAYRDFEARVEAARAELAELDPGADPATVDHARGRIDRLTAEWIGIGRKREIEEAFRIVQEEAADAGFEDERLVLKARFEAGEKKRIDAAGLSYFKARLVPLAPLFAEESDPQWQRVDLSAEGVAEAVDGSALAAFGLATEQVARAAERLRTLTFEFIVCSVLRDWLDRDFFTRRYWRLGPDDGVLSDGRGGGRLPVLPTRIVFVRDARAVYEGDVVARPGTPDGARATTMATLHIRAETAPETVAARPKLIAAAANAGFERSLRLLRRDEARAADASRPATTAIARGPARVELRPQLHGVAAARFVPSATAVATARFLHAADARIAARPGRTVRDHRSRGDAPRPRVRDHRTGAGGRPIPRVGVSGTVHAAAQDASVLERISLAYTTDRDEGREHPLALKRESDARLSFATHFTIRGPTGARVARYTLVLRAADGAELVRHTVEMGGAATVHLDWTVASLPVTVELASPFTPTLHAYGIELVPACPDPDEGLDWP